MSSERGVVHQGVDMDRHRLSRWSATGLAFGVVAATSAAAAPAATASGSGWGSMSPAVIQSPPAPSASSGPMVGSAATAGGDWPIWASVAPGEGTIRQVATSGSDASGDGSAGAPLRTIQHAIDLSAPGDEVWVRRGVYPGDVRIRRPRITLRGTYGPDKPQIVVPHQDESSHEIAVELDPDADGSRIIGMDIAGGSYYGVSCETKWDWGDPADRSGATHVVIAYNTIHDSGRDAVKIKPNCDDVLVARNEIHSTGRRDDGNAEGIDNVNGDRMTVLDNHLHDIATTGLYFKGGATDVRVERNLIERVGRGTSPDSAGAGILVGFDTDTDYFDLGQNPGMYEAIRGRVVNNIIDGTTMTGIGVYSARDSLVAHNTIRNCCRDHHAGIHFGISLQSWMPDGLRPPSTNVRVWGNLIGIRSADGVGYGTSIRYLYEPELGHLAGYAGMPLMDYNVYSTATPPLHFADARPAGEYDAVGLSGWAAHIGGEGHSSAAGFSVDNMWVPDPAFPVDPGGRYSVPLDFYRQVRSGRPIAGAVESRPATGVAPPPDDPAPPSDGAPDDPPIQNPAPDSPAPGARSRILARWRALGGAHGPLGRRVGAVRAGPLQSRLQRFARGAILYSPATGAFELMGRIATTYFRLTPSKRERLGLPISGDVAPGRSRKTRFRHGSMTWSPGERVVVTIRNR